METLSKHRPEEDVLNGLDSPHSDVVKIVDIGVVTHQGSRPRQEDRYAIVPAEQFSRDLEHGIAYFAVFDGHGGSGVAHHASKRLRTLVAGSGEIQSGNYEWAIRTAFKEEDRQLREKGAKKGGSTVALCLIDLTDGLVVAGNLGDSHIILAERDECDGTKYKLRRLTKEHKPDCPEEMSRIKDAGGRVQHEAGSARIGGVNMSRALGDLQYKTPGNQVGPGEDPYLDRALTPDREVTGDFVSNDPHLESVTLTSTGQSLLILATDGVGGAKDAERLLSIIEAKRKDGFTSKSIAQDIVEKSTASACSDNCTCIVVILESNRKDWWPIDEGG